jgi:hypothetical protein
VEEFCFSCGFYSHQARITPFHIATIFVVDMDKDFLSSLSVVIKVFYGASKKASFSLSLGVGAMALSMWLLSFSSVAGLPLTLIPVSVFLFAARCGVAMDDAFDRARLMASARGDNRLERAISSRYLPEGEADKVHENSLQMMIWKAFGKTQQVLVTLRSQKVYTGFVSNPIKIQNKTEFLVIWPQLEGYRDKKL